MNQEKPKTYSSKFRESLDKLAIESDQTYTQIARELGINPNHVALPFA